MTGSVVHLNRERWLNLGQLARIAVRDPGRARELGLMAGRMATATPPSTEPYAMTACLGFRWLCQAYAHAPSDVERCAIGEAMLKAAECVAMLFADLSPEPAAAALARPAAPAPETLQPVEHPWMRRRDIMGG